ncbi:MAG TPA: hypothetical protein VMR14_09705 [Streptosporangiaceae bacterium]|nr:hypothetical protein [Streptosporangiaceae bacterium]
MNPPLGRALARTGGAIALSVAAAAAPAMAATPASAVSPRVRPAAAVGWRVAQVISAPGHSVLLGGIDAVSASDAWAGGVSLPADGEGNGRALIEHWDGRAWHRVVLPAKAARRVSNGLFLGTIGASSARDVWAFSEAGSYLRRSGTRWTFGGLPGYRAGKTVIFAIKVFGPDDAWVFGARTAGHPSKAKFTPYAARFNGRAWTSVRIPGTGIVDTVSAISADDMWALAGSQAAGAGELAPTPGVEHWNGRAWRAAPAQPRLPKNGTLSGIVALAPHDVWVGGSAPNSKAGSSELARHWNGRAWTNASPRSAPTADDYYLASLTPDGHGGLWALGAEISGPEQFWHYSHGRWQAPGRSSWDVLELEAVPRTGSTWALAPNADLTAGLILLHGPRPS